MKMAKKKGNARVTSTEQYYTPLSTAISVLENVASIFPNFTEKMFIEPAGGTGAFIHAAKEFGVTKIISYDIEPLHDGIIKGNFLQQSLNISNAITVSNPPFGRNNSLSIPFFNHSAKYSEIIVFIVPRSWRKWSVTNRLNRQFHLVKDDDLNINYVDSNGNQISSNNNLRTCVQYWHAQKELRNLVYVKDMKIVEKCSFNDADVALTVFGYSCGNVKIEFERKENSTLMFLRLCHSKALEALQSVDFSKFFMNTAYTEALSMPEINYLLNEYVFGDPMITTTKK